MGNNYLHRKWVIRIILFILLLGAVGMTKAMAQTSTNTPASVPIRDTIKAKTVGIIPYSDDFITQEEVMERNYAITSFRMIDTATVAVLTGASDMILVYSLNQNQILRKIQLPISARAFDYDNSLFHVIGDKTYLTIDAEGRIRERKDFQQPKLPNEEIFIITDLKVVDGQPIIHECNANTYSINSDGLQKIDTFYYDCARGCKIHPKYIDENSLVIYSETPSKSGRSIVSMESIGLEGKLACLNPISVDDDFIAINLQTTYNCTGSFVKSYLLVVNLNGELINLVEVPINCFSYISKPFCYKDKAWYYAFSGQEGISFFEIDTSTNMLASPDSYELYGEGIDYSYYEPENETSFEDRSGTTGWRTITQTWYNGNQYRTLEWTPIASNIAYNCTWIQGLGSSPGNIKTPDYITTQPNETKIGVPYKRAGYTRWQSFKELAGLGRKTGNCHYPGLETCDGACYSESSDDFVIGVDCSGFVTSCWEFAHLGTYNIPTYCTPHGDVVTASESDFQKGDALNWEGHHVMLYTGHNANNHKIKVFESTGGSYFRTVANEYDVYYFSQYGRDYKIQRLNIMKNIILRLDGEIQLFQNDIPVTTVTQGVPLTVKYFVTNAGTETWSGNVRLFIEQSTGVEVPLNPVYSATLAPGASQLFTFSNDGVSSDPGTSKFYVRVKNGSINGVNANDDSYYYDVGSLTNSNPLEFEIVGGSSCVISASASPSTGGTVSGAGTYIEGSICTLNATPSSDYNFVKWSKNGTQVSTNPVYSFQVTESASYVASFVEKPIYYNISVSASPSNGGTVTGSGNYVFYAHVTLTATPNPGYVFERWTKNGTQVSTNPNYMIVVTGDANYEAVFSANSTGSGILSGIFSVGANTRVNFSQGNLQYQASSNTWRFATNQYDYLGSGNANISSTYSGWIDLFCWGTSGYNHGAVCYQPWSTSTTNSDYYAYGSYTYNLYDQTGKADWGYNRISNGGNTLDSWRTPTRAEWAYMLNTRNTTSGIRYAKAQVNGVKGLILLPDDWSASYYSLNSTNTSGADFSTNVISSSVWANNFESHGAVFLPTAGMRFGTQLGSIGVYGLYWSSSYCDSDNAGYLVLGSDRVEANDVDRRGGLSVRLVTPIQNSAYTISVTANPSYGGSVSGGGTYIEGSTCVLTATPATGYNFVRWTKNGSQVSTNPNYSFTVTGNASYVAVFSLNSYSISASANPSAGGNVSGTGSYNYGNTCTLTATPNTGYSFVRWTKNGSQVSTSADYSFTVTESASYVAVFSLNNYTISASANPTIGGNVSGAGTYNYGNTCTLTASPATGYTFVRWTKNGTQVSTNASYTFTVTASASYVAVFEQSTTTQSQTLFNGWNWWSSYVELSGIDGLTLLENSLGSAGTRIKSRLVGYVDYYSGYGWYGSLSSICNEQMYMINMNANCNVVITSYLANPSNHSITINPGWNWIGYVSSIGMDPNTALASLAPTSGDKVKSYNQGYVDYYPGYGWFGSLNTITPGMGLMYYSANNLPEPVTLTYPSSAKCGELKPNLTSEDNVYRPIEHQFAYNMTITAVVEADGEELRSDNHELAAFVDGECRGSIRLLYVEPIDRYVAFLTVFGEQGDELEFRLTDGLETQLSTDVLVFDSDDIVGTLSSPQVLHFGTMSIDETLALVRIYPNPVHRKGMLNITLPEASGMLTVEIGNMLGVTVFKNEIAMGPTSVAHITLPDAVVPGTYILKATRADGTVYYGKLVVE